MKYRRGVFLFIIIFYVIFDHVISYLNYEGELNPFANYFIKELNLGPAYFVPSFFIFLAIFLLLTKLSAWSLSKMGVDGWKIAPLMIVITMTPNFIHTLFMYFDIYHFQWLWEWNLGFIFLVLGLSFCLTILYTGRRTKSRSK